MRNWRWLFAAPGALGLMVSIATPATADQFYAGHLRGQYDSQVLIHRNAKLMKQAVVRIRYEDCESGGEDAKPGLTSRELVNAPITGDRFSIRKHVEAPSQARPPQWEAKTSLSGLLDGYYGQFAIRASSLQRRGDAVCRSGLQEGSLHELSRARYERIFHRTFPGFDPVQ